MLVCSNAFWLTEVCWDTLLHTPSQALLQALCTTGMALSAHDLPPQGTLTLVLWSLASLASGQGGGVVRFVLASHAPLLQQLVVGVHCVAHRCV